MLSSATRLSIASGLASGRRMLGRYRFHRAVDQLAMPVAVEAFAQHALRGTDNQVCDRRPHLLERALPLRFAVAAGLLHDSFRLFLASLLGLLPGPLPRPSPGFDDPLRLCARLIHRLFGLAQPLLR